MLDSIEEIGFFRGRNGEILTGTTPGLGELTSNFVKLPQTLSNFVEVCQSLWHFLGAVGETLTKFVKRFDKIQQSLKNVCKTL